MTTLRAAQKSTAILQLGQTLNVAASTGVGTVRRIPNPRVAEPLPPIPFTGSAQQYGPFNVVASYEIECNTGTIAFTVDGTPALVAPEPYVKTVPVGKASTVYLVAGNVVTFSGAAIGSIIPIDNNQTGTPILFAGSDVVLGPFASLKTYAVVCNLGSITITTAYGAGVPTTPAPVWTVDPSITAADGTPQVGELLTGNDGTITGGSVSARQWLLNGSAIEGANGASYTPGVIGEYRYRVTASGAGGDTTTTSGAVTVAAASGGGTPTPTPSFAAPTLLPQTAPTSFPPLPFLVTGAYQLEGSKLRVRAAATYADLIAGTNLIVDDATFTLTNDATTNQNGLRAKLAGIGSGVGFAMVRNEESSIVFSEWSIPVQYGTAALPTIISGLNANATSTKKFSNTIVLSAPVKNIYYAGDDQIWFEAIGTRPGTMFVERWLDNADGPVYTPPSDFNTDHVYERGIIIEGLNGVLSAAQAGQITLLDYDTIVDVPNFTSVTGAALNAQQTSNTITITGIAADYIGNGTITGGTYSKNGGAYTNAAFTYALGDTFTLRRNSSASYFTGVSVTFLGATWNITTMADPTSINPIAQPFTHIEHDYTTDTAVHPVTLKAGKNALVVFGSFGVLAVTVSGGIGAATPIKRSASPGYSGSASIYECIAPADGVYNASVQEIAAAESETALCAVAIVGATASTEQEIVEFNYYPAEAPDNVLAIGDGTVCPAGGTILAGAWVEGALPISWAVGTELQNYTHTSGRKYSVASLAANGTPSFHSSNYGGQAAVAAAWGKS